MLSLRCLPHGSSFVGRGRTNAAGLTDGGGTELLEPVVFARPSPMGASHISILVRQCVYRRQSQWVPVSERAQRA